MALKSTLSKLQLAGLYRENPVYEPIDGAYVLADGRRCLQLASNNYLGMTHELLVQQAAKAAIDKYGTGSGGARLTTGSHPLYAELENKLAKFKETEAALVFNTGYMANIGAISALMGKNDVIFSDELNHASIIDGCRLSGAKRVIFPHSDMSALARLLAGTACSGNRLIAVDGVFSMDGDIAPLPELVQIAKQYQALLMVDDAHATGVIGNGHGTAAYFGLQQAVPIQIGTLSKALGGEGGYVAGKRELIDFLINKARSYIFSTALAPATIAVANAALDCLIKSDILVKQLLNNAMFMREQLAKNSVDVIGTITPILPIVVGEADTTLAIAKKLAEQGIIVSAIRPPTVPQGQSRLRITVTAKHNKAELQQAAKIIGQIYHEIKG